MQKLIASHSDDDEDDDISCREVRIETTGCSSRRMGNNIRFVHTIIIRFQSWQRSSEQIWEATICKDLTLPYFLNLSPILLLSSSSSFSHSILCMLQFKQSVILKRVPDHHFSCYFWQTMDDRTSDHHHLNITIITRVIMLRLLFHHKTTLIISEVLILFLFWWPKFSWFLSWNLLFILCFDLRQHHAPLTDVSSHHTEEYSMIFEEGLMW